MFNRGHRSGILLVNAAGGVVGSVAIVADAMPVRAGGPALDIGAFPVVALVITTAAGAMLGRVQGLFARTRRFHWPVGSMVACVLGSVLAYLVVTTMVQFGRVMPVPGGGQGLDPTLGELRGGLLYWTAFVVSSVAGLALTRPEALGLSQTE